MPSFFSEIDRRNALLVGTIALAFLVLGVVACQPQGQQGRRAAVDTSAIQSKLDSLGRLVSRANRTGDAELFASTWAKDGIMSGAGSPLVRGRDSIVAAFTDV